MPRIGLNAHLLSHSNSYRSAGVSRYIAELMAHLPTADPDSEYLGFVGDRQAETAGWRLHTSPWPTESPPLRIAWEQLCQPIAARRLGLDLLHAPVNVGPLVAPCPLVVTVHDLSFVRYPALLKRPKRLYLERFTRWSLARARAIIAVSESTRQDLIDLLGADGERVHVVPNGVDDAMRPVTDAASLTAFRRAHDLPEQIILFVGTLEPRKNLPVLLEAYARLVHRDACPHLLVIAGGQGWYYDAIYTHVRQLGLEDAVRFVGYVPYDELRWWYSAADLLVYPSLYEGFGLPPLEAMACGTPVVVSNVSSLPEVVGDAGLLVDPQDAEELARAMSRVLTDRDLHARLTEAGLSRSARYSWRATAERTARVYRHALGARGVLHA